MSAAERKRIFVGLSGGVDSSVAALRLHDAGHEVVGVFIKGWHPDFLPCPEERERLDAMRVAAHLGIPFLTFDAEEVYKREVAKYMINEYKAGRTPNPDVMCNRHVKFGAFLAFALAHGADGVATGHYAQVVERNGVRHLLRGVDTEKDQSYFLWTLTRTQLTHIYFPVGDSTKETIRKEAAAAELPTATKKDSQGICFLGKVDMKEFLTHYIDVSSGVVTDTAGNQIGTHEGALLYTLGQRHGFTIDSAETKRVPHYVVDRDLTKNIVVVDTEPAHTPSSGVRLTDVNQIQPIEQGKEYLAQFRYRQTPFRVRVRDMDDDGLTLEVLEEVDTPSAGQSCVLYSKEDPSECLGGGIIAT